MAVPKRKTSKSVRGKRRTHKKVKSINLRICSSCGEEKLPHHVCSECGVYRNRFVITGKKDKQKKE